MLTSSTTDEEDPVAGLFSKIAAFARTPAGQKAIRTASQKAQELAKDPKNRDKVDQFRRRVSGGSGSGGQGTGGPGSGGPSGTSGTGPTGTTGTGSTGTGTNGTDVPPATSR